MKNWVGKRTLYPCILLFLWTAAGVCTADGVPATILSFQDNDTGLSDSDKHWLLDRYVRTFEEGRINLFLSLFSDKAHADDQYDKSGIRQEYALLFSGSRSRKMDLKNVQWHNTGGNTGYAVADFQLKIVPYKGGEKIYTGAIEMHVRKENDVVLISELYHAYDTAFVASQD